MTEAFALAMGYATMAMGVALLVMCLSVLVARTGLPLCILLLAGCGGGGTDTSPGAMPIAPIDLPASPASQPKQARR